jgi:hypothetical protein
MSTSHLVKNNIILVISYCLSIPFGQLPNIFLIIDGGDVFKREMNNLPNQFRKGALINKSSMDFSKSQKTHF